MHLPLHFMFYKMPPALRYHALRCIAAFGMAIFSAIPSHAGPPYFTDDPVPTETGHWEIYGFAAGTMTPGVFDGATGLDLNYGPVRNVQLTATLPLNFTRGEAARTGLGDIELGVKVRFFERTTAGVSLAVFPRVILPTATNRFGADKVGLLLPLWGQKDFGAWSVFGGGGYTLNPGAGNRNFWQGSVAVARRVNARLSLGAEIMHRESDTVGGQSYTVLNAGGICKLFGPFSLLFSGGPGLQHIRDGGQYNVYVGLGAAF